MKGAPRYPSLFDPDSLMQAAELQLLKDEYKQALQEPPWDGESHEVSKVINRLCTAAQLSML